MEKIIFFFATRLLFINFLSTKRRKYVCSKVTFYSMYRDNYINNVANIRKSEKVSA